MSSRKGAIRKARAFVYYPAVCFFIIIVTFVFITTLQNYEHSKGKALSEEKITEASEQVVSRYMKQRRRLTSEVQKENQLPFGTQRQLYDLDVERTNITVVLEHLQLSGEDSSNAPWMYTEGDSPFLESDNQSKNVHGFTRITWNDDGRGNGSCGSGGSGKQTRGYLDPFHNHISINDGVDFTGTKIELHNLSLTEFYHMNTIERDGNWKIMGRAGDSRRYKFGTFRMSTSEKVLIDATNVQWLQNVSYPRPIGEAPPESMYVGGYFVGEINEFGSDEEWVSQLDPHGIGYILGILTAASFGPSLCITSNTYWVTLRGFPNLYDAQITKPYFPSIYNDSRRSGAKSGVYRGSNESTIRTAQTLANLSITVVTTAVSAAVVTAAGSAAAAVIAPSAITAPPGSGMFRMVTNTAFVARINEVYGFHSDAMAEFGDGLKPFIGKLEFPFSSGQLEESSVGRWLMRTFDIQGTPSLDMLSIRQEEEDDTTITDSIFSGCALYTSAAVLGFLALHLLIWISTRKRPIERQLTAHAWMVYIFSIVMSYVFTAAVLNAAQYLRSHIGKGTGKRGLFAIAFLQLFFIGFGFTAFFLTIMYLALRRVQKQKVKWVPREKISSPTMRNQAVIAGEYQAEENNIFHTLFECYYSSLAGPRLWFAGLELVIMFLDALCTATIWNEVICLGVLVCVYSLLFLLFLVFAPYVDKIEGRLVTILGFIDLIVMVLEFLGALGNFDTAEKMEDAAVILGFVSIGVAVLIAIYCDVLPMLSTFWSFCRRRYRLWILGLEEGKFDSNSSFWTFSSRESAAEEEEGEVELELELESDSLQVAEASKRWTPKGLIQSLVRDIRDIRSRPRSSSSSGTPTTPVTLHAASTFDWRERGMGWDGGVPMGSPHSVAARIVNSADSQDAIEWPRVGQVIYSIQDLRRRDVSERSVETRLEMEDGIPDDAISVGSNSNFRFRME